jgi:hypothetical protein
VPVPLLLRDEKLSQGPVDPLHQRVGGQPCTQHKLAGAIEEAGAVGQCRIFSILGLVLHGHPGGACNADQIRPPGRERIPAGPGNPPEGGQQFGIFDGCP